jgi:hypothetical protein
MTEKEENRFLERKYQTAIEIRNFEIELFWKRSLFFGDLLLYLLLVMQVLYLTINSIVTTSTHY